MNAIAVYRASNWAPVGLTKGYARGRGGYTDPHGKLKEMYVYPLGRSSVARLCATEPHPDWEVARTEVDATEETLPSLLEELQRIPDFRHAQGRRHKLATVLGICVLARLAGKVGCDATARYAKTMPQEHLAALDARQDRISDLYIPPSRATIHRVMVQADSDEVQAAANRWAQAHPVPEILLCPSACHGTSCGLSGEREGGGPGPADWECFPFPVSLHPLELSAGNSSSGLRSRAQRPVRRTSADAPPGRRILVRAVNLRFAVSHSSLQEPAVHPR